MDPYGGVADLQARVLRHVSPAFSEDPVRVLRVARFAARFASLGFTVHESTRALMRQMVDAGEVAALVSERVWQETERALGEARPEVFFEVLRDCGALAVIFPEVDRLFGVPQPRAMASGSGYRRACDAVPEARGGTGRAGDGALRRAGA